MNKPAFTLFDITAIPKIVCVDFDIVLLIIFKKRKENV